MSYHRGVAHAGVARRKVPVVDPSVPSAKVGRLSDVPWFRALGERSAQIALPGVLSGHLRPGVLGAAVLDRPRLVERLRRVGRSPMVLATGPAGSGKSTMLCQWVTALDRDDGVGWLSLHSSHDAPARFWMGVLAALRVAGARAFVDLDGAALKSLVAEHDFVGRLLGELDASGDDVVLVVDDFQVITSEEVRSSFGRLVAEAPPTLQLGIGSRVLPRLRLARQRTRRTVLELSAVDLAFTPDEIVEVLAQRYDAPVEDLALELFSATEGLPALVALTTLVADSPEVLSGLLQRGLATDRWLADFVVDELVESQDPELRSFLIETAFLAELHADLCDATRDRSDSARHIEGLDQLGLLVQLDEAGRWWRHHHLVTEVLDRRRTRAPDADVVQSRTRAARWMALHGHHFEAVEHALAVEQYEIACENIVPALEFLQVDPGTTWFDDFPDDVLVKDRDLFGELALHIRMVGTPAQVERLERLANEVADAHHDDEADTAAPDHDRVWSVLLGADFPAAVAMIDELSQTEESPLWQRFLPGMALCARLGMGKAAEAEELALRYLAADGDPLFQKSTMGFLSIAQHHLGRPGDADACIGHYPDTERQPVVDISVAWARALAAIRRGDVDDAQAQFDISLAETAGEHSWPNAVVRLEQVDALYEAGAVAEAEAALQRAEQQLDRLSDPGPLADRFVAAAARQGIVARGTATVRSAALAAGLSARELEVLVALSTDGTLRALADQLGVSPNTIKSHTRSLYRKLGVAGRDEAVARLRSWEKS